MSDTANNLRPDDSGTAALRQRAERKGRSMQDLAKQAVWEYVDSQSRAELIDSVLDTAVPQYAEAVSRLAQ